VVNILPGGGANEATTASATPMIPTGWCEPHWGAPVTPGAAVSFCITSYSRRNFIDCVLEIDLNSYGYRNLFAQSFYTL